jgi:hypothetical protein
MVKQRTKPPVGAPSQQDLNNFVSGAQANEQPFNPLENSDPKAPRKYKAVAIPFNKYEFDRLDAAVHSAGMGKNEFIRAALEAACKKILK